MSTAWFLKELNIIILLCLLFGAIILFFLFLIIFNRFKGYQRGKNYRKSQKRWDRYFFPYLEGDLDLLTFPRIRKKEMLDWERYLYDYLKSIRGEERDRIIKLAHHTGLIHQFIRFLKGGCRWEKARAARFLGVAGDATANRYLRKNLYSKDKVVFLAAARALAAIGTVAYFHEIINVLLKKSSFTYEAISEVLFEFGEDSCPLITETMRSNVLVTAYRSDPFWGSGIHDAVLAKVYHDGLLELHLKRQSPYDLDDPNVLCLYIDMLAAYNYLPAESVLRGLIMVSDMDEVLIHCLKALERVGSPETAPEIAPLLQHHNWVIRSQAARAIGTINPEDFLEELGGLMQDEHWWVCFRAGEALLKGGERGFALLERMAGHADRSGEMANNMLAMARR